MKWEFDTSKYNENWIEESKNNNREVKAEKMVDCNYTLASTEEVNGVMCDFFVDGKQIALTREQIGMALGYANPKKAIEKIHLQHKERLDRYSFVANRVSPNLGGTQSTTHYTFKGILEICRWSRQPKADEVMDRLYDIAEKLLTDGYVSRLSDGELLIMLTNRCLEHPKEFRESMKQSHHSVMQLSGNLLGMHPWDLYAKLSPRR